MKILLLGFAKYRYMPYANFYLDCIDRVTNDVHMVIWNRDLNNEKFPKNVTIHELSYEQKDQVAHIKKLIGFFKYRTFSQKVIKRVKPDFIIVLHTFPGVLLYDVLTGSFKNKYIFDYRDSTYESNGLFKRIVGEIVKHSRVTFVSSNGFRKFLPAQCADKIHTSHNLLMSDLEGKYVIKEEHLPIRIGCWGLIREEKINRQLIKCLSNDKRFELYYYGREQQVAINLKKYVKEIDAQNVYFYGEYLPDERKQFAANTDILHNMAGSNNMMLAVSNKLYDGLVFKIPQICFKDSFMANIVTEYGVGLEMDPFDDDFSDKLYEYYISLDRTLFSQAASELLNRFVDEHYNDQNIIKSMTML